VLHLTLTIGRLVCVIHRAANIQLKLIWSCGDSVWRLGLLAVEQRSLF